MSEDVGRVGVAGLRSPAVSYFAMLEHTTLGIFVAAALALLLTPGPAVLYIVARSVEQGRVAGLVSVLGICTGTLFHVAAAALGLTALLASSAPAFTLVRYVGALYLIAMGMQTLTSRNGAPALVAGGSGGLRRVFAQGAIVNLLNPHTALFCLAFLPQFVNPARGGVPFQIAAFGLLFVALSMITDSGWAIAAGTAGDWIKTHPQFARGQRYVTGGTLMGLGAAAAFSGGKK
jgi:threonine/homoserine/homoserine lactone efflux protein